MKVNEIAVTPRTTRIFAELPLTKRSPVKFEFTSYLGGPFEVYDFPADWCGVARFVGYMTAAQSDRLRAVVARPEHDHVRRRVGAWR